MHKLDPVQNRFQVIAAGVAVCTPQRPAGFDRKAGLQLIFKGDANYRRILGDRYWQHTTPFSDVLSYSPTNLLALRVLKSEVMIGLKSGEAENLYSQEPDWLYSGRWSSAQFFTP